MTRKPFKELQFSDAFMFAAVMEDEDICRQVLERILEFPIKSVKVRGEATLLINPDYRGVRLDVLADDEEGRIFDIEMQITDQQNLPKRSRVYQSRMDLAALKPGQDFNLLPASYVIFICTFDPFGYDLWRYTCYTYCKETGEELGDMAYKIFLNTKGTNTAQEPPELADFLRYVDNSSVVSQGISDPLIHQIETRISSIKQNNGMEVQYMLFGELLSQERREGRKEAQDSLLLLITAMTNNGDSDKIPFLSQDPEFLNSMYLKYNIHFPDSSL